jgi:hypothetical protein
MKNLYIALIILFLVVYFIYTNNNSYITEQVKKEHFINENSRKYEVIKKYQEDVLPNEYQQVGYRNLFDWNKSVAIPISPEANQIAYDINSDKPTGLAYNSRYPWIAPTENPANIPNSRMNIMKN